MDVEAEEGAILLCRQTIKVAKGDFTTRRLIEEVLGQEEKHHDIFSKLLVGMIGLSQPEL